MNLKLERMRKSAKAVASILRNLREKVAVGVSGKDLEERAVQLMEENGVSSSTLGYRGFPAAICVSVSNKEKSELTHGIPTKEPFENGDLVKIDVSCFFSDEEGVSYHADAAITVAVGQKIEPEKKHLIETTRNCLNFVVEQIVPGKTSVNQVGKIIRDYVSNRGLKVIKEYGGHGIGGNIHEPPFIPNFPNGDKTIIKPGTFICIEPLVQVVSDKIVDKRVVVKEEGGVAQEWKVVVSPDNHVNAHFEHTIYIGEEKAEILTNHDY